jgi:hypothetical protein
MKNVSEKKLNRKSKDIFYEACSESNAPLFSHSRIKIAM